MSIIAKYKFDKTIYADLLPEFNAEFTSDKYNTTDEEVDGIITRTIESNELPTLMRFGSTLDTYVEGGEVALLEVLDMNTSGLTSCYQMFRCCKNLTSITCEWDTSNVASMYAMFNSCNKLTTLDVSNFNTSKVTDMGYTFSECNKLTTLDVSNFDTSKVTTMSGMFNSCYNLTSLDASNWNTNKVTNMSHMFSDCNNLTTLDVSNWNTSKVTYMNYMFSYCHNLTTLDVSNFDTSNVTTLRGMFSYAYKLASLDVSNWNTSNVTDMGYMLSNCTKLTSLDISNFDTNNVTDMVGMFNNTPLFTDIGMIYCDQPTINKVASLLPTDITQTIWVEDVDIKDLTPVEGVEFKQYAKNTEIMLTSPLLEGDKLVVKDGKLYHWHKMGMVVLDGSENFDVYGETENYIAFYYCNTKIGIKQGKVLCNNFGENYEGITSKTNEGIEALADNHIHISISNSKLSTVDVNGFKQWLQVNPTTVVYELASPYYELISEDPLDISLIAESSDITNSSNIPLNMTINNKGLSTIAMSPSTTYTVAFDKDTDSEVVVNLCGNEVTTTDNVVEITTPSEIDDELIFYGDGVEVSNVRLLEGSVSGDSIPRESFEGLKNSFEEGYIPENVITKLGIIPDISQGEGITILGDNYTFPGENSAVMFCHSNFSKPHTFVVIPSNDSKTQQYTVHSMTDSINVQVYQYALGFHTFLFNQPANMYRMYTEKPENSTFRILILEGDWTHLTEEDWNNLGKYKVEYKVTGKNKAGDITPANGNSNDNHWIVTDNNNGTYTVKGDGYSDSSYGFALKLHANVNPNTTYTFTYKVDGADWNEGSPIFIYRDFYSLWDKTKFIIASQQTSTITFTTPSDVDKICIGFHYSRLSDSTERIISNIQLEEGTVATKYESYKSYTKTFYLNSPLLEGDTIEDINGVATHVKRYGKVVLDGSNSYPIALQLDFENQNKTIGITVQELMDGNASQGLPNSYSNRFISYTQSILHRSDIEGISQGYYSIYFRINKSKLSTPDANGFKQWLSENPTTIIYQLASPIYEPISTESILCDSYVNGHLDVDTNIPVEKVEFKYWCHIPKYIQPSTKYKIQFEADNTGWIDKIALASTNYKLNIPVTKGVNVVEITTDELAGSNLGRAYLDIMGIGFNASNIQVVATDRDADFGYFKGLQSSFEEKTAENLFDESCLSTWWLVTTINIDKTDTSGKYFSIITKAEEGKKYTIKYDYMNRYIYAFLDENYEILKGSSEISMLTTFQAPKNTKYLMCYISSNGIKEEDYDNIQVVENSENFGYEVKCKVVGKNKFDKSNVVLGYWGTDSTTYHTNIPSVFSHKTPIKVKPNTWYTMQSLGVTGNVYVVGLHPFESICVVNNSRVSFYTNNRTEVYIQINTENTDLSKFLDIIQLEEGNQATSYEPYQEYTKTIHLNSPLLKGDTIEVHNGKLCHYHKMGKVVLDGSEIFFLHEEDASKIAFRVYAQVGELYSAKHNSLYMTDNNFGGCDNISIADYSPTRDSVYFYITFDKSKSSHTLSVDDFKQWLQANPTTVVYELAEPYYEEITPTQEDLIITSVKEGDLHIDTIVPISSKVTYNVNVQLLTDFEQSIVEQVQATQTTDLQSILDEEIDN